MARRGVYFEIAGLTQLAVSLDALRDDVRARLSAAIEQTSTAIQTRAQARVPRSDVSGESGDLARAIQTGGRGLSRSVGLSDGDVPSRRGTNTGHLNPWVYGAWVEFGLKTRRMAAQPFMGPAADAEEARHQERIERALAGAVESA